MPSRPVRIEPYHINPIITTLRLDTIISMEERKFMISDPRRMARAIERIAKVFEEKHPDMGICEQDIAHYFNVNLPLNQSPLGGRFPLSRPPESYE